MQLAAAGSLGATVVLTGVYFMPPYFWPPRPHPPVFDAAVESRNDVAGVGASAGGSEQAGLTGYSFIRVPAAVTECDDEFHFAVRDIHQPDAGKYLVKTSGMRVWTDQFMFPRISYWCQLPTTSRGCLFIDLSLPARHAVFVCERDPTAGISSVSLGA